MKLHQVSKKRSVGGYRTSALWNIVVAVLEMKTKSLMSNQSFAVIILKRNADRKISVLISYPLRSQGMVVKTSMLFELHPGEQFHAAHSSITRGSSKEMNAKWMVKIKIFLKKRYLKFLQIRYLRSNSCSHRMTSGQIQRPHQVSEINVLRIDVLTYDSDINGSAMIYTLNVWNMLISLN